jgi:hypothetical protein
MKYPGRGKPRPYGDEHYNESGRGKPLPYNLERRRSGALRGSG